MPSVFSLEGVPSSGRGQTGRGGSPKPYYKIFVVEEGDLWVICLKIFRIFSNRID